MLAEPGAALNIGSPVTAWEKKPLPAFLFTQPRRRVVLRSSQEEGPGSDTRPLLFRRRRDEVASYSTRPQCRYTAAVASNAGDRLIGSGDESPGVLMGDLALLILRNDLVAEALCVHYGAAATSALTECAFSWKFVCTGF